MVEKSFIKQTINKLNNNTLNNKNDYVRISFN